MISTYNLGGAKTFYIYLFCSAERINTLDLEWLASSENLRLGASHCRQKKVYNLLHSQDCNLLFKYFSTSALWSVYFISEQLTPDWYYLSAAVTTSISFVITFCLITFCHFVVTVGSAKPMRLQYFCSILKSYNLVQQFSSIVLA